MYIYVCEMTIRPTSEFKHKFSLVTIVAIPKDNSADNVAVMSWSPDSRASDFGKENSNHCLKK